MALNRMKNQTVFFMRREARVLLRIKGHVGSHRSGSVSSASLMPGLVAQLLESHSGEVTPSRANCQSSPPLMTYMEHFPPGDSYTKCTRTRNKEETPTGNREETPTVKTPTGLPPEPLRNGSS